MSKNTPASRAVAKQKITAARAVTAERHGKALELRKAGASYEAIAKKLEYGSRAAAYRAVQAELKRVVTEPASELLEMEIARLDSLRTAHWVSAMQGDINASRIVLSVSERLSKLRGLDDYERRMAEVAERRQALDEAQAALVTGAVLAILSRLNLTPEQQAIAAIAAPEELRRVAAEDTPAAITA